MQNGVEVCIVRTLETIVIDLEETLLLLSIQELIVY